MLNIDEIVIIYIILNYKIKKRVTCVLSCYTIINWVVFEFVIFDLFFIHVVLVNTVENLLLTQPMSNNCHPYSTFTFSTFLESVGEGRIILCFILFIYGY